MSLRISFNYVIASIVSAIVNLHLILDANLPEEAQTSGVEA